MSRPERALILGAGQGSRLLPLTEQLPKCLLDLGNGRSMLEWQLRGLMEAGIGEAVVVTGFRSDLVEQALQRITPAGMTVRTLFNPFYKLADNLASCWMARSELRAPCLILNGDTLFEPEIARRLLAAPAAPIEGLQWGELDFPADLAYVRTLAAGWLGADATAKTAKVSATA